MQTTSMTGIFQDLIRNRQEATATQKRFVVVSLKKDGRPYTVTPADRMSLNATRTMAEAEKRVTEMTRLNPGKTFTIVTLEP